jgi:LysM repeat protein
MTPERLEELLRTRPSDERTYNRALPDLAMRRAPVRASRSGLPMGWAAAALAVGLVAVIGAGMFGPWQHSAAKPSAAPRPAFSATGSMNATRQSASATLLKDGRVLMVGGHDVGTATNLATVPSAELYDPATGKFTLTGSPHVSGIPITSALMKSGRVLVIGCDPSSYPSGSCTSSLADVYDPTTGLFSAAGPITGGCFLCTATLLNDGRVLVARGADQFPQPSLLFDPSTNAFATTGSMTTSRLSQTATLLSDGRVLIAGGFDGTLAALATAELYDPMTGTFSPTGSMGASRGWATATLLSDGRVLIAGGATAGDISTRKILASAELYDPKTGTFSPADSMTTARGSQTATLLSDGRVLIAGGSGLRLIAGGSDSPGDSLAGGNLASAELYDPKTGTFSPAGTMTIARSGQTATLLSDGRVLIAGGGGDITGNSLSSAEIYDPSAPTPTATAAAPTTAPTTAPSSNPTGETLNPTVVQAFGTDQLSAAVLGPDGAAYVIDSTAGSVNRISLQDGASLAIFASNVLAPDGTGLGRPKLLAVGGGDILILNDANVLWRWHPTPGSIDNPGTLLKVNIPDNVNWGVGPTAMGTFIVNAAQNQYNFYIALPGQNQIVKYSPAADGSGYPTEGMSRYLAVPADVSTVDDMYVDGNMYLVDHGKITRYSMGQAVAGWSTGRPSGTAEPSYTKLAADSATQDVGLLYAYDQTGRRIVAFNKSDGRVAGEYTVASNTHFPQSLTGMFVSTGADGSKTLYWTEGGNLMKASLTQGAATSSPGAGATFTHYVVQPGDQMWALAAAFHVALADLLAANPQVSDPSNLVVGELLNIPPVGWHAQPTKAPAGSAS